LFQIFFRFVATTRVGDGVKAKLVDGIGVLDVLESERADIQGGAAGEVQPSDATADVSDDGSVSDDDDENQPGGPEASDQVHDGAFWFCNEQKTVSDNRPLKT